MGFYTFSCLACGKTFETRCTIAEIERKEVVCPACGGRSLSRVFGSFSVSVAPDGSGACPAAKSGRCPHSGAPCPHAHA